MTLEPRRGSTPWRQSDHQLNPYGPNSGPHDPKLSAPTAINPTTQSAILHPYQPSDHRPWINHANHREESQQHWIQPGSEYVPDASDYQAQSRGRYRTTPMEQERLHMTSPRRDLTSSWQNWTQGMSPGMPYRIETPMAVGSKDSPTEFAADASVPPDGRSDIEFRHSATPQTSLPPFASLQQRTRRSDDVDGPEIAPMSQRITCSSCTTLQPVVHELALAAADLDQLIQTLGDKPVARTIDIPEESPARTAHWILDRLRYAKVGLQATRRGQSSYHVPPSFASSRPASPENMLKRNTDQYDRDDLGGSKRSRYDISPDQHLRIATTQALRSDRYGSIDDATGRQAFPRTPYSPQPLESLSGSVYQRQGSPIGRAMRALPSPSSMAYPSTAVPSFPPTIQSFGSPTESHQRTASTHTPSTNSVTSAHIADLQHQVTLKSLGLRSLEAEYASLLQKLQRERVKSQTIEKKTSVADQEVNDLTSKNEELTEHVKTLEAQVEGLEEKRELERVEVAKDKEQWGRMLDMSGRIQAKHSEERQKLKDENDDLIRLISDREGQPTPSSGQEGSSFTTTSLLRHMEGSKIKPKDGFDDVTALKRNIEELTSRNLSLRSVLTSLQSQSESIDETVRSFAEATRKALTEDQSATTKHPTVISRLPMSTAARRLEDAWRTTGARAFPIGPRLGTHSTSSSSGNLYQGSRPLPGPATHSRVSSKSPEQRGPAQSNQGQPISRSGDVTRTHEPSLAASHHSHMLYPGSMRGNSDSPSEPDSRAGLSQDSNSAMPPPPPPRPYAPPYSAMDGHAETGPAENPRPFG